MVALAHPVHGKAQKWDAKGMALHKLGNITCCLLMDGAVKGEWIGGGKVIRS